VSFPTLSFTIRQGQLWPIAAMCIALFAAIGCSSSDDGPRRYRVSGEVLYDGKPLPAGKIFFAPDTAAGNSGPGGYTDIVDGQYDTDWDHAKGVVPGPLKVRIEGFDGQSSAKNDFHPKGNMLFPVYRDEIDVPEEASVHDFDIPLDPK